jgi:PIN domain nuclease of toxin-antitoxin system
MLLLLDTCAAIWISENSALSDSAVQAMDQAEDEGRPVFVSPITAWEIALLVARGRLALPVSPEGWFDRLMQAPTLRLAELPPPVLIASAFLPGMPPRDPSDRILAATARAFDLTLVTRDKLLLHYAAAGHLRAIKC